MKNTKLYIGIGVLILVIIAYFIYQNKKTGNNTETSYNDFFGLKNVGQKDESTTTTNQTAATINIKNTSLTVSPGIGILHLKAEIEVANQPSSGILVVLLGNNNINEVQLPLSGTTYYLDEYVTSTSAPTYNLTAKIGSITKTVQITI